MQQRLGKLCTPWRLPSRRLYLPEHFVPSNPWVALGALIGPEIPIVGQCVSMFLRCIVLGYRSTRPIPAQ